MLYVQDTWSFGKLGYFLYDVICSLLYVVGIIHLKVAYDDFKKYKSKIAGIGLDWNFDKYLYLCLSEAVYTYLIDFNIALFWIAKQQ